MSYNLSVDQIEERIQIIVRQTDYSEDVAREKLIENNYDHVLTIKAFHGITDKTKTETKYSSKSLNQEIYKQIRYKLDESMREYTVKKEKEEQNQI
jgi:hypothetical protein